MSFTTEIHKFKAWAASVGENERTAEWELRYAGWQDLYAAFDSVILALEFETHPIELTHDLLYAIARDNEAERLVDRVAQCPNLLMQLAEAALDRGETECRWQLVDRLGVIDVNQPRVEQLIIQYLKDDDEYVRRRALMALGHLGSEHLDSCVRTAWQSGELYQRIACLWALRYAGSPALNHFIDLALDDGRRWLVENVEKVRAQVR